MRLIDADEFISVCEILTEKCDDIRAFEQAIWIAKDAPTIDAVPVIRCRYCAFSEENKSEIENRWCHKHMEFVPNDYYCAGGKR